MSKATSHQRLDKGLGIKARVKGDRLVAQRMRQIFLVNDI